MSSIYINEPATNGKICLNTTVGDIDIELWSKECPIACKNFIQLCMEGYYNGTKFHRLVKNFIVQGGDPSGTGSGGESIYSKSFKNEFHQRLKFNRRGLVGMVSNENGLNDSQFFFTLGPTPELDKKNTLFGKIVGDTLFNMLTLNETEVENERPVIEKKIINAIILNNPFPDIKPRIKEKKKTDQAPKKEKIVEKSNLALLSFGSEEQEHEEDLNVTNFNQKFKSKSAHDVLSDETLSKDLSVLPEELEKIEPCRSHMAEEESELDRIRQRFLKRKREKVDNIEVDNEEDLEGIVDQDKKDKDREILQKLGEELRKVQKDLVKSRRKEIRKEDEEEEKPRSERMKLFLEAKLKYKKVSEKTLSDPERQIQTLDVLKRFTERLKNSTRQEMLSDKVPQTTKLLVTEESEEVQVGKINLEVDDIQVEECFGHKFVGVKGENEPRQAKDANLKDKSEDWYDLNDPRNKINKRRRGEQ